MKYLKKLNIIELLYFYIFFKKEKNKIQIKKLYKSLNNLGKTKYVLSQLETQYHNIEIYEIKDYIYIVAINHKQQTSVFKVI